MNYREFNERVYNYKHGIKTVADDQSNSIEHSAKGDEWDSHKYKEKIYLGEGKYRYIYDDGTSSTGYKPLEYNDPARQQQRAKPLVDNFNARVETKETAQGISQKLANDRVFSNNKKEENERNEAGRTSDQGSNIAFKENESREGAIVEAMSQPNADVYNVAIRYSTSPAMIYDILSRKNPAVITPSLEAIKDDSKVYTSHPTTAGQIGDFLKANVQSPSNRDFTNARKESYDAENKAKAPQAAPSAPVPYAQQDKEIAAGKSEEEKRKVAGTPNASVAGKVDTAVSANNIGSFLRNNIDNPQNATNGVLPDAAKSTDLGATATGIADALGNKKEGRVEGTPYNQLTAQSVAATNNPVNTAQNIADSYMSEISHLKDFATRAGMSEAEFWKIIDSYETVYGGEPIASSLNGVDRNNINWMEGADAGMQNYMSNVLPKIQEGIADRMNKMSPVSHEPSTPAVEEAPVQAANTSGESWKTYEPTEENINTWKNVSPDEKANLIRGILEGYLTYDMPADVAAQLSFGDSYAKSYAINAMSYENPEYKEILNAIRNGDLDIMNVVYETDPEVKRIADQTLVSMVSQWPRSQDYILTKLFGYGK